MKFKNTAGNFVINTSIDYLVFGHVTEDLNYSGSKLGGTATFSGLTAKALGLQTGIITAYKGDLVSHEIDPLLILNKETQQTTTFKNISDGINRKQYLYQIAEEIRVEDLPVFKHPPKIVHLGPVADEVDPAILYAFPNSLKCLTPQGWFRKRDNENLVNYQSWSDWEDYLPEANAVVISLEDVKKDEEMIARMAAATPVFVVTENYRGARVYWNNDARFFNAPAVKYLDDTGAGDIFATAFFYRYYMTKDPWEAGRFAVLLASWSVTRHHFDSIPSVDEINKAKSELLTLQ